MVEGSEWIDFAAPDAPELVVELYPEYLTLPPGLSEEKVSGVVGEVLAPDDDSSAGYRMQDVGIASTYEFVARCSWYVEWMAADDVSDDASRERATDGIETAAEWPATAATDGGGIVAGLRTVVGDARRGDRDAVVDAYKFESCPAIFGAVIE